MTYTFLQHYWCFIVSLLGALLVFLLFVQGANSVARTGNIRWCILRILPTVLLHLVWWRILAMDDNTVYVCATGCELRIPEQDR